MSELTERVRHCDFYRYDPECDEDWSWVHACCGGPWAERPQGHYAGCPVGALRKEPHT